MARHRRVIRLSLLVLSAAGLLVAGALAAVFLAAGLLAVYLVFAVLGGLLLAGFLHRQAPADFVADAFAPDGASLEILNMAHVRIVGVGGLGLLIVAALTALEFPLIAAVMAAGLAGGLVAAVARVLFDRRHHHAGPTGVLSR